jgi:response regulator of citrate/malate metabolism
MSNRTEQRICLRFCFHLGKTATEAHEMLQKAFKEEVLSRSGRPSTSHTDDNVEKIREQINEDCRYTIDEISEATTVSWSSCQRILPWI